MPNLTDTGRESVPGPKFLTREKAKPETTTPDVVKSDETK
jgi:hypothetical protein